MGQEEIRKEILEVIEKGESETLEFKTSLSDINEVIKDISAFSNTSGGRILVGISDSGKVLGLQTGKDTIEKLTNRIIQNTEPKVYPKISVEKIDSKEIILIEVKKATETVLAFGKAFKRVSKSTHKISREEYERMILEKRKNYFDSDVCEDASLEDIDEEKVRWFLRKAKYERNFDVEPETPVEEALEKLKLTKNGKLTNAAILLFGKKPQKFFLQAETRCARFKGTEPLEFIDMKVFSGNIINQRDDAVEFIKEHIKLHAKIVGTERVEEWEYPIEAIREAITNAICHRDYEIASNAQIRIFDDRIEIWGCGPLPKPLTPDDLKKKHKSILRNLLIGKCFFLIKFIEEWGTGTNRMIKDCLNYGLPEPLFEEITESLVVTFRKYSITEEIMKTLNERQRKAIDYLLKNKKISNKDYRTLNQGISDRTALNDFNELIKKNIIVAKGDKKYRYYLLR
jgi:ATP-dependent DNA helicase RecG